MSSSVGADGEGFPGQGRGDDLGPRTEFVIWNMLALALFAVACRGYSETRTPSRTSAKTCSPIGPLFISGAMLLVACALESRAIARGHGQRTASLPAESIPSVVLTARLADTFASLSIFWSKIFAVAVLWPATGQRGRKALQGVVAGSCLAMFLSMMLLGVSVDMISQGIVKIMHVFSTSMDVLLVVVAAQLVPKISMNNCERLGAALGVACGVCAAGAGLMKQAKQSALDVNDFTYTNPPVVLWGVVETTLIIVAASVPATRTLFEAHPGSSTPSSPGPQARGRPRTEAYTEDVALEEQGQRAASEHEALYRSMRRAGLI